MRFILAATIMIIGLNSGISAEPLLGEHYLGAYLGTNKIGYMSYKIDKSDKGYNISSIMDSKLKILGTELSQHFVTLVEADHDMNPLSQDFSMSSGGKTTKIHALYYKDRVDCTLSSDSGSSKRSIDIPAGTSLVADNLFGISKNATKIGSKSTEYYFNPVTLSIDTLDTVVERAEKIVIGTKTYETMVMKSSTNLGDMTIWKTADGNVVQVEAVMGIRFVKEDPQEAAAGLGEGTPDDFALLTSVKPDKPLENARKVKALDMEITGLGSKAFAISDPRQRVSFDKTTNRARVRILVPGPPARPAKLPVTTASLLKSTVATPYLDKDNPTVKKQARLIAGKEKSIGVICSKIRSWLHNNMVSQPDIGIARSTSDVLNTRTGVCRDYAVAFAGLARSLGIPAKVVSGLVYSDDAFYYHAWVECWNGRWSAYDATLSTDFVDATHVKLAEGDATSMFSLSKVIGGLQIKIISCTID